MCNATNDGPRHLPCCRLDPHSNGHIYDCGDVADGRHDDNTDEE
tara:strand:+ start:9442 stop:9573 length:132 start_codon:yes stop_codon:yes gene_type:complete